MSEQRLIDANAMLSDIKSSRGMGEAIRQSFARVVEMQQTIEAVPVVRGRWVHSGTVSELATVKCSACSERMFAISRVVTNGRFCPNCGARMEEEAE